MRTIVSQDGKNIIVAENVANISVKDSFDGSKQDFKIEALCGGVWYRLGYYKTEERAGEVMAMLNEWLSSRVDMMLPYSYNMVILSASVADGDSADETMCKMSDTFNKYMSMLPAWSCFQMPPSEVQS